MSSRTKPGETSREILRIARGLPLDTLMISLPSVNPDYHHTTSYYDIVSFIWHLLVASTTSEGVESEGVWSFILNDGLLVSLIPEGPHI